MAVAATAVPGVEVRAYLSDGDIRLPNTIEKVILRPGGFRWHLAVWRHLRLHPVAAYVSTSLVVPNLPGVPSLPVVLDMSSFRVPQHQARRTKIFEHTLMGRAISRHPLIFGSQAAATDTQGVFPNARGVVVPPWFAQRRSPLMGSQAALDGLGVRKPYVLMVGTVEPRKNVLLAARVVGSLRERGRDLRLVLVGRRGWSSDDELSALRELERQGTVIWPGYVTDEQRDALYSDASALLMPSIYEGFGMPLVEAMAAGVPCCCSAIPAFKEVAGDAAIVLDPTQPDDWVEAIESLLDDPERSDRLRRAGLRRAEMFSVDRTARAFTQALDQGQWPMVTPAEH